MKNKKEGNKVSIIGAGAVGSTLAMRVVESGLADVVLLDIVKALAVGKSLDISDAAPIIGHRCSIKGTDSYEDIRDSDMVVITAGFPRRPGMTREELTSKNAAIVKEASERIRVYAPRSIVIIVTNPLDAMTYLAYKTTRFERERIFGMAGELDGARFRELVSEELGLPRDLVKTVVVGSHGDSMVPVLSQTTVDDKHIEDILPPDRIESLVKRTRERGMEIVSLLGTGSAYFSPSAACSKMIKTVLKGPSETLVVSAYLKGEYGLNDICIGVPCSIGRRGIEKVIELKFTEGERLAFLRSADSIRKSIEELEGIAA